MNLLSFYVVGQGLGLSSGEVTQTLPQTGANAKQDVTETAEV